MFMNKDYAIFIIIRYYYNNSSHIYCRFVCTESTEPESHFLGVKELPATRADDIFDCMIKLLTEKGLDPTMMVGLATDGASAMQGCRTGVVNPPARTL